MFAFDRGDLVTIKKGASRIVELGPYDVNAMGEAKIMPRGAVLTVVSSHRYEPEGWNQVFMTLIDPDGALCQYPENELVLYLFGK
jgi:hypothetical protein